MTFEDCKDCEYFFKNRNSYIHQYIGDVKVIIIACPKHREQAYQTLREYRRLKENNELLKSALKEMLK